MLNFDGRNFFGVLDERSEEDDTIQLCQIGEREYERNKRG